MPGSSKKWVLIYQGRKILISMAVEKVLTVLSVTSAPELSTGDQLTVVSLGDYVDKSGITSRLTNPEQYANQIPAIYLAFFYRASTEVPYRVGSKWRMRIEDDGSMSVTKQE